MDWFHLFHAPAARDAGGGETYQPMRRIKQQAKAAIVEEVERLRWRVWHGKAKKARLTLKRVRKLLAAFTGNHG